MTNLNSFGRRPLLRGMIAAGPASLIPAAAQASTSALLKLDPANPVDQALIFRKLSYASDDSVGYWWLLGTRYGLVETKLVPLWQIHIGSIFTVRDLAEGSYEVTRLGATFYTDLKTGQLLKKFLNPLNNKVVDLEYYPPKSIKVKYDIAGLMEPAAGRVAGGVSNGAIGPAWIEGDDVWVQSDHLSDVPPVSPGKRPVRVSDLVTYFGSLKEVANPAVKMPAAGHAFTDINSWPDWLEMGDRPGDYYSRCYGRKVASYAAMPEVWRRLVAQEYPSLAKDPVGVLRG